MLRRGHCSRLVWTRSPRLISISVTTGRSLWHFSSRRASQSSSSVRAAWRREVASCSTCSIACRRVKAPCCSSVTRAPARSARRWSATRRKATPALARLPSASVAKTFASMPPSNSCRTTLLTRIIPTRSAGCAASSGAPRTIPRARRRRCTGRIGGTHHDIAWLERHRSQSETGICALGSA